MGIHFSFQKLGGGGKEGKRQQLCMQGLAGAVCVSVLMGPCHLLEAGGSHNPAAELSCPSLQSLAPLRPPAFPACRDAWRQGCRRAAPGPGTPDRGTVHSVGDCSEDRKRLRGFATGRSKSAPSNLFRGGPFARNPAPVKFEVPALELLRLGGPPIAASLCLNDAILWTAG